MNTPKDIQLTKPQIIETAPPIKVSPNKKGRRLSLDILKLLMSCFVVLSHAKILRDVEYFAHHMVVNGLFRITVPCFLAISGYYFYRVIEKKAIRIWAKKMIIPYIVWMIIYIGFWFPEDLSSISIIMFIKTIFYGYFHLWYISGAICAGIMLYFLQKYLKDSYLIALALGLYFIGMFLQFSMLYNWFPDTLFSKIYGIVSSYRNFLFFAFPFFLSGYLIRKYDITSKIKPSYLKIFLLIAILSLFSETLFNYHYAIKAKSFVQSISIIFLCPLLIMGALSVNKWGNTRVFAQVSASIFYVHPLLLSIFWIQDKYSTLTVGISSLILAALASFILIKINQFVKYLL